MGRAVELEEYIRTDKHPTYVPHTAGRWQKRRFHKATCPIVERMICAIMRYGRNCGKKSMAVQRMIETFEIMHLKTDENPIKLLIKAVENGGAREDSQRIGSGGVVRRQSVDVSPLRRVNQAMYNMSVGSRETAFRNIATFSECLADEIIAAANKDPTSAAIKKKDELERIAKSN